jgi:hypothetical protein
MVGLLLAGLVATATAYASQPRVGAFAPSAAAPAMTKAPCGANALCGSLGRQPYSITTIPNHIVVSLDRGLVGHLGVALGPSAFRPNAPLVVQQVISDPVWVSPRLRPGVYAVGISVGCGCALQWLTGSAGNLRVSEAHVGSVGGALRDRAQASARH